MTTITRHASIPEQALPRKPRTPVVKCWWQVSATDTAGVTHTERIWGCTTRKPRAASSLRFWRVEGFEFAAGVVVSVERVDVVAGVRA